ncbi:MAG: TetR/AcrR family transcriptional regulator [Desulfobacterales bacterium]|jgi:AcrR family transcriptional regulator|nr:TetR/AcrR family transcriptional regulator [Desulfobacteraceae bacterium]MBT4363370.1 TetR/AcrR family transcriptional regulator [Desulfobacteraceae bacterium]MBT7086670.1 TetR/AcrR family transcriptional regulator [Desulfobacterales bacterium]MBT7697805.1 TetR/AcrR family transcriptional regulator [Desulfobacterales bacterium]
MEKTKDLILTSAMKQFARYGFKKTSLDDIVRDVKISKGTIYIYFKNKEDLFRQSAEIVVNSMLSSLKANISPENNTKENIVSFTCGQIQFIRNYIAEEGSTIEIFKEVKENVHLLSTFRKRMAGLIQEILETGIERNFIKITSPHKTAVIIIQILEQFELRWTEMSRKDSDKEIHKLFELIFHGIEE